MLRTQSAPVGGHTALQSTLVRADNYHMGMSCMSAYAWIEEEEVFICKVMLLLTRQDQATTS